MNKLDDHARALRAISRKVTNCVKSDSVFLEIGDHMVAVPSDLGLWNFYYSGFDDLLFTLPANRVLSFIGMVTDQNMETSLYLPINY